MDKLGRELISLGPTFRLCLKDKDEDGKFDRLWTMDEVGHYRGATSGYVVSYAFDVNPPVKFKAIDDNLLPEQKFGVKYHYRSGLFNNGGFIESVALVEKKSGRTSHVETLANASPKLSKETSFPMSVMVGKVKIEIIDHDHKAKKLTYKILEIPKMGDLVLMARPRAPQYTYVYY